MGVNRYKLLNGYREKSFKDTNKILYNHFFLYVGILLGFTVMSVTFLNRLHFLFTNPINIFITCFVLSPIIYLILKSIYGLILLQESYQGYHHKLISEFSLLYVLGYHIILLSFYQYNLVYCYESLLVIMIGLILKHFKNQIILFVEIVTVMCVFCFFSSSFVFNIYLVILTFIFTLLMLLPIIFIVDKEIDEQIKLIALGNKNHPEGRIKDFIR